ncbi:hypothetical protein BDW66DRAFT_147900 [Aspergillus desertorum]
MDAPSSDPVPPSGEDSPHSSSVRGASSPSVRTLEKITEKCEMTNPDRHYCRHSAPTTFTSILDRSTIRTSTSSLPGGQAQLPPEVSSGSDWRLQLICATNSPDPVSWDASPLRRFGCWHPSFPGRWQRANSNRLSTPMPTSLRVVVRLPVLQMTETGTEIPLIRIQRSSTSRPIPPLQ